MNSDRKFIRKKHDQDLESSMRFGDWSLDKYKQNTGYVVYHWVCGFWNHTFYHDSKNCCPTCTFDNQVVDYPDDLEAVYRLANFDLMTSQTYNASNHD